MVRSHTQYTEYEVSIDSKVVCLWFTKSSVSTAELNLKLKSQADNIIISPNLIYDAIAPLIDGI
jgi:NADH:ubiquinone oxidoreductase subunit H